MKVVKIVKSYQSGTTIHTLVVDDLFTDDQIEYLVEEWCEKNLAGATTGYEYEWSLVKDKKIIKVAINNESKRIKEKIKKLNKKLVKMEKFRNKKNQLL